MLQRCLLKVNSRTYLRCKEHIWIKQTGNIKCARTEQNLNRSINIATRTRVLNSSSSWPCVSITLGNAPLVLSHFKFKQEDEGRQTTSLPSPFLTLRIHSQNHIELEDPYIKAPIGTQPSKQQNATVYRVRVIWLTNEILERNAIKYSTLTVLWSSSHAL